MSQKLKKHTTMTYALYILVEHISSLVLVQQNLSDYIRMPCQTLCHHGAHFVCTLST